MTTIDYARRHKRFGWWSLFVFATLGLVLELFHGFKIQAYLAVSNETRRLMWTLAHAHGVLVALVNVVFGMSVENGKVTGHVATTSVALLLAGVLLPLGFFLAGITFYSGDPGLGIALVPAGAAVLLFALFRVARNASSSN
jgi:hypothetical protein